VNKSYEEIFEILGAAKKLAQRDRTLPGKPLGIAGEVAEFEAARLLGVELVEARQAGYDATRLENGETHRLTIKGRCVLPGASKYQQLGGIDIEKEFDGVLLVQWTNTSTRRPFMKPTVLLSLRQLQSRDRRPVTSAAHSR
jgi:hypothetical protein